MWRWYGFLFILLTKGEWVWHGNVGKYVSDKRLVEEGRRYRARKNKC